MRDGLSKEFFLMDEEVDVMPSVELVESERVAYVQEMEDYLTNLKNMPDNLAQETSRENLLNCNIIQENGDFTERYKFSRINAKKG